MNGLDRLMDIGPQFVEAALQTLVMVSVAVLFCVLFGLLLGSWLAVTSPQGIAPHRGVHQTLAAFVNISRSVPFLILIVLLLPLTRLLIGTSIGTAAAIVPLVIGGTPYAARLVEAALLDVDPGLIQAMVTLGASPMQAVLKAYIPEAVPGLIRAFTVLAITMINFSAMAGAVGGGGLGDLAIRYGYQRFRIDVLLLCCVVLIVLVQLIQFAGNHLARRFDRR
jgi:ABC-type methionine transport system permease subunit